MLLLFPLLIFFAAIQGYALDVTLEWDANSEPDLAGYRLYYKVTSSGAPYDGTGAAEGSSPTEVGNATSYTLTGLAEGVDYYFVVTAYDSEDLESEYSNEVTTTSEPTPEDSPTDATSSTNGEACFIGAISSASR